MSDEIKSAYSRGYNAGKRRRQREIQNERRFKERQAFLDRAFIAALPAVINADGWKAGDKPITTLEARIKLAADFARAALLNRPIA